MQDCILEMKNITKRFSGVTALENVDFSLKKGEIHALIGENGAGKSTLMNVLMGVISSDEGTILYNGEEIVNKSPHNALTRGIGMVPQELNLVPELSISENIFLGNYRKKSGLFDSQKTEQESRELLATLGVDIDVTQNVSSVSAAYQQLISIARTLGFGSQVIVLDEPTASLTISESEILFEILRRLSAEGRSIIYISHHLDEIQQITDRTTIMRDGVVVHVANTASLTTHDMIFHMANQEVENTQKQIREQSSDICVEVRNLSREKEYHDISFSVKKAEILGVAGLVGSGRTELFSTIAGLSGKDSGQILFNGKEVNISNCHDAIKLGIGLVPEERRRQGIFPELSVTENLIEPSYKENEKRGFIDFKKVKNTVKHYVDELRIKTSSIEAKIKNLSGGNQQKVVLGRWMAKGVEVLILDEPTRGIDVRAKGEIYKLIHELANDGMTIIFISSEIDELLSVADRIIVMREGKINGEIDAPLKHTRQDVLKLAMQ